MTQTHRCRRCLLEDIESERSFYDMIQERNRLLPKEQRADDTEYTRRLTLCRACDQLMGGTCLQCGCYVELRAAKRGMRCPHHDPKW